MFRRFHHHYLIAEDPSSYAIPLIVPVHIWWSKRKDIVTLRKKLIRQWLFASFELWILIFVISALYLGSGYNTNEYTTNLEVAIVDFDGGLAGNVFLNTFRQTPPGNLTLGWRYKFASDYNNNIDETRRDLENGKVWALVILLPNTTRFVNESLLALINTTSSLSLPFALTPSVLVLYESGRNSYTANNYILPPIVGAITKASLFYGQILRAELINNILSSSNSSVNRSAQLLNALQLDILLTDPLTAEYQNIHPAFPLVGSLATSLGYIYIYLITILIINSAVKSISQLVGKIHWFDLLLYRVLNGLLQTFILSLIYSLIVLWFFDIHSGGLFIRFWMFNWLSSLIFTSFVGLLTVNLGHTGSSVLTAVAIFMLAGGALQTSLELSPPFFRYGYGLPFNHILSGSRHLLFGSYTDFPLDVGLLLLYFFVPWILAIVTLAVRLIKKQRKILKGTEKVKTEKPK